METNVVTCTGLILNVSAPAYTRSMTDDRRTTIEDSTTGRRAVLSVVGGTIVGSTTVTGKSDVETSVEDEKTAAGPGDRAGERAAKTRVEQAFTEQETLIESGRYCSVDEEVLESVDRDVGDQIRVRRTGADAEYAVYTVSESRDEDGEAIVRMGLDGRERFGTDETFLATVNSMVPRPDLSEDGARENGEFIEHLEDRGERVVIISPHGGDISPETDAQADLAAQRVSSEVTRWGTKGWREGGGAFERWFISPRDISPASFPELARLSDREFEYGVSFRGLSGSGIEVVGDEDGDFTRSIADAIEAVVGDIEVETRDLAEPDDAPFEDDQLTERLTGEDGQSVWLGQGRDAREDYGEAIATAVAAVLEANY